jgi:hypothetical protein
MPARENIFYLLMLVFDGLTVYFCIRKLQRLREEKSKRKISIVDQPDVILFGLVGIIFSILFTATLFGFFYGVRVNDLLN